MRAFDFTSFVSLGGVASALAIALVVGNLFVEPALFDPVNFSAVVRAAAPFVLVSMAAAVPIISGDGGVDISVGPTVGLVNAVLVAGFTAGLVGDPMTYFGLALLTGVLCGAANGLIVTLLRVPPVIATLGTYLIYGGLVLVVLPQAGGGVPDWFGAITRPDSGLPTGLIFPGVAALIWLALMRSPYRLSLYAVGGDSRAAFASGVNVVATRAAAYVIAGTFAALAGLALTMNLGTGDPLSSDALTIASISGAVLGGINLRGGSGSLIGAAAGGVILFLLQSLMSALNQSSFTITMAGGLVLIGVLILNRIATGRAAR